MCAGTHILQPVVHDVDQAMPGRTRTSRIVGGQEVVLPMVEVVPGVLAADAEVAAPRQNLRQGIRLARTDPLRRYVNDAPAVLSGLSLTSSQPASGISRQATASLWTRAASGGSAASGRGHRGPDRHGPGRILSPSVRAGERKAEAVTATARKIVVLFYNLVVVLAVPALCSSRVIGRWVGSSAGAGVVSGQSRCRGCPLVLAIQGSVWRSAG